MCLCANCRYLFFHEYVQCYALRSNATFICVNYASQIDFLQSYIKRYYQVSRQCILVFVVVKLDFFIDTRMDNMNAFDLRPFVYQMILNIFKKEKQHYHWLKIEEQKWNHRDLTAKRDNMINLTLNWMLNWFKSKYSVSLLRKWLMLFFLFTYLLA